MKRLTVVALTVLLLAGSVPGALAQAGAPVPLIYSMYWTYAYAEADSLPHIIAGPYETATPTLPPDAIADLASHGVKGKGSCTLPGPPPPSWNYSNVTFNAEANSAGNLADVFGWSDGNSRFRAGFTPSATVSQVRISFDYDYNVSLTLDEAIQVGKSSIKITLTLHDKITDKDILYQTPIDITLDYNTGSGAQNASNLSYVVSAPVIPGNLCEFILNLDAQARSNSELDDAVASITVRNISLTDGTGMPVGILPLLLH